jgi:hypothetical protein
MSGRIDSNPKESWNTSQHTEDRREKIQALSLAKECYSMKLDLLTNTTVVDDAIRFVSESGKSKDKDKEREQETAYYGKYRSLCQIANILFLIKMGLV